MVASSACLPCLVPRLTRSRHRQQIIEESARVENLRSGGWGARKVTVGCRSVLPASACEAMIASDGEREREGRGGGGEDRRLRLGPASQSVGKRSEMMPLRDPCTDSDAVHRDAAAAAPTSCLCYPPVVLVRATTCLQWQCGMGARPPERSRERATAPNQRVIYSILLQ